MQEGEHCYPQTVSKLHEVKLPYRIWSSSSSTHRIRSHHYRSALSSLLPFVTLALMLVAEFPANFRIPLGQIRQQLG